MKKTLVLVGGLMLCWSNGAFAGSVICKGSGFSYEESTYRGGAHPMPGMVVRTEIWKRGKKVIGQTVVRYDGPTEKTGVQGEFDETTRRVTDDSHASDKPVGSVKYTIQATVARKDGSRPQTVRMSCKSEYDTIPRPIVRPGPR